MAVREAGGVMASNNCCLNAGLDVVKASMKSWIKISPSNGDCDRVVGRFIGVE